MSGIYGEDIQRLLIQGLISNPDIFARAQSILNPKYFEPEFQSTIKFILNYAKEYNTVPTPEQIKANTDVDLPLLTDFTEQHHRYYLDEIEKFCKHKALVNAIMKSADYLEKGNEGGIEKLIKEAILVGLQKDLGINYFEDPRARLMSLKDQNGNLSTGWKGVDAAIYNPGRGELLLFTAPSGGGKSVALQNLTVNMASQKLNCVYITLELSEELCAKRMDSMLTEIASKNIFRQLDDVELKVKQAEKRYGSITVKYFPSSTTRTLDIKAYLKEYEIQKGYQPDLVAIDYLDLLAANDKRIGPENMFVKDKFISEELRALAKEFKFLCATASQLNRTAEDAIEYNHAHIAGGKSKIDTADNVIAIHDSPTQRDRGEIRFQYLKTRNSGGVGSYTNLAYDLDTLRITDLSDDVASNNARSNADALEKIKNRKNTASKKDENVKEIEEKAINNQDSIEEKMEKTNSLRDLINKTRGN